MMTNESFIVWKTEYSVECPSLDEGHSKILSTLNRLRCLEKEGIAGPVVKSILQDLLSYTQRHCALEESLMLQWNYPGYAQQHDAHTQMIGTTKNLVGTSFLEETKLFEKSVGLLTQWWVNHIQTMDRGYIDAYRAFERKRSIVPGD
jgi:hemerythrin-like metal-binding protein